MGDAGGARPEWLVRAGSGIEGGHRWTVVMEGVHHAVVRKPGQRVWSGIGMEPVYHPTEYALIRKGQSALNRSCSELGTGRLTKALRESMRREMERADACL